MEIDEGGSQVWCPGEGIEATRLEVGVANDHGDVGDLFVIAHVVFDPVVVLAQ
jgi:hypothetical protein